MPRSIRAQEAFKTALAMAIVYGIALSMGWDKPYWAGFAVAMISLGTAGQSLQKGVLRMLGTVVAVIAALTLIALFPQERWLYLTALSLYVGFCTYMMTGPTYQYFWQVSAFVCLVIAADSGADAVNAFEIAIERAQETGLGILIYSLIAALLWPRSSAAELEAAAQTLAATHRRLFRSYRGLLAGQGRPEDSQPLRMQVAQLVGRVAQLASAAQTESYQVWELRRQWRRHVALSKALGTTLERWRESFPEVQQLDLGSILPELDALSTDLDRRLEQIERILAGKTPSGEMPPIALALDRSRWRELSHFQAAAVSQTKAQLDRLEQLSRLLVEGVRDLKGFGPPAAVTVPAAATAGGGPAFDVDRMGAAIQVMTTLWIAFLLWVYVDPPGHAGFVSIAPNLALAAATMPQLRVSSLLPSFAGGCAFAGVLYVFVMPQLSGYGELGLMIFLATFAIYYRYGEPRRAMAKLGAIIPFIVLVSVQNEQTYSFAGYANTVAMIMLAFALVIATAYIPTSPRPEKAFLRLHRRFFRHGAYLLARLALDWEEHKGLRGRWQTILHRSDLVELPEKLQAWARHIDHRVLPENPEQVAAVVDALRAVAYRIEELVEARRHPQAEVLVQELLADVRPWRVVIQRWFERWAATPGVDPGDLQVGLAERLTRLERRIDETLERVEPGHLREVDYDNLYRLLGAYRGLSEAVVAYARAAEDVDWARWQEARF